LAPKALKGVLEPAHLSEVLEALRPGFSVSYLDGLFSPAYHSFGNFLRIDHSYTLYRNLSLLENRAAPG